jgi:hypothetical protein
VCVCVCVCVCVSYIHRGNGMNTWREKMKLVLCFTSIIEITLKELYALGYSGIFMSYIIIRCEINIIDSNNALAFRISAFYINKCREINIVDTKNSLFYINLGNGMNTWREKMKLVLCFTSIMEITLKELYALGYSGIFMSYIIIRCEINIIYSNNALAFRISTFYIMK